MDLRRRRTRRLYVTSFPFLRQTTVPIVAFSSRRPGGLRVVSIHLVPVSRGLFARTSQQLLFSTVADPQFASEESPSGMLARSGSYVVRSRVIDDDAHVWLDFEWGESGSVALTPCVTRRPVWLAARSLERTS